MAKVLTRNTLMAAHVSEKYFEAPGFGYESKSALLSAILEEVSYRTSCARDGSQTLLKLRNAEANTMIVDASEPASFFEACEVIQFFLADRLSPAILLTVGSADNPWAQEIGRDAEMFLCDMFYQHVARAHVASRLPRSSYIGETQHGEIPLTLRGTYREPGDPHTREYRVRAPEGVRAGITYRRGPNVYHSPVKLRPQQTVDIYA